MYLTPTVEAVALHCQLRRALAASLCLRRSPQAAAAFAAFNGQRIGETAAAAAHVGWSWSISGSSANARSDAIDALESLEKDIKDESLRALCVRLQTTLLHEHYLETQRYHSVHGAIHANEAKNVAERLVASLTRLGPSVDPTTILRRADVAVALGDFPSALAVLATTPTLNLPLSRAKLPAAVWVSLAGSANADALKEFCAAWELPCNAALIQPLAHVASLAALDTAPATEERRWFGPPEEYRSGNPRASKYIDTLTAAWTRPPPTSPSLHVDIPAVEAALRSAAANPAESLAALRAHARVDTDSERRRLAADYDERRLSVNVLLPARDALEQQLQCRAKAIEAAALAASDQLDAAEDAYKKVLRGGEDIQKFAVMVDYAALLKRKGHIDRCDAVTREVMAAWAVDVPPPKLATVGF